MKLILQFLIIKLGLKTKETLGIKYQFQGPYIEYFNLKR